MIQNKNEKAIKDVKEFCNNLNNTVDDLFFLAQSEKIKDNELKKKLSDVVRMVSETEKILIEKLKQK